MTNSRKNRVKLLDIAQASGVSLTAASLALSDKPGISQETRSRVIEVARSMGYRFKVQASPVVAKPIKTLGLLVKSGPEDEPQANNFYSLIIMGIEQTCRQMGINLMFANLPVDSENHPLEKAPLLENSDIDAVIVAGIFVSEAMGRRIDELSIPVVLVDSYSDYRVYNSVLSDNVRGAYKATEYLINKGHRQIGFVGGHADAYPSLRERRAGYLSALQDYGIKHSFFANSTMNRNEAASAAVDLLAQNPGITALVGMNDETAIAAMYGLIEAGYNVPQDISVIGFDDIYLAENVMPSLTTMRVHKLSMGRLSVQLLQNQVSQMDSGCVTSIFRPSLVERNSVMPVIDRGGNLRASL